MTEEVKTEGICLRSVEYGESDRIITLLTDKLGKIAVRVRGVSSPKSALRVAASPFAFGEYILLAKGEYYSLKSFDYNDCFPTLSDDLVRYFCATSGLEIADKLTEESEPVREELARLLRFLMTLTYDKGGISDLLVYLLDMLRIDGYGISQGGYSPDRDPKYYSFDLEEGGLVSSAVRGNYVLKITSGAVRLLYRYLEGERAAGERTDFAEIFALLSQYVKLKTGKNLRALFELSDLLRNGI